MQKHVYEYAVIRVVPRVEREEFLNVGVILFSKSAKFICVRLECNEERLKAFAPDLPLEQITENLEAFKMVAEGGKKGGPIGHEELPERFRWLTAQRSSIIQTSRPHPGLAGNLEAQIDKLLQEYVL